MIRSLALVLVLTTFACKKSEQVKPATAEPPAAAAKVAPTEPAPAQPAAGGVDAKAVCIQAFTRSRECTDDFIPALVDARASADQPPGIADAVKKDRDGVIAQAKQEWANDSKDDAIAANCEKIAAGKEELAAEAQACLAKTDCKEFVACAMPIFAKQFGK